MVPIIYILDDDPDFCLLLETILKKHNFKAESFDNPEELIKKVEQVKPNLCFIDLNLGKKEGEGFKVIETLKQKFQKSLPLIVLSRRSSRDDITKALELGASDYLTKPLDDIIMLSKVKPLVGMTEDADLPFFKVPDSLKDCDIETIVYLSEISEDGLNVLSNHLFSKGALVDLSGSFMQELTSRESLRMPVVDTWKEENSNLFGAYIELPDHDHELRASVRTWISKNKTSHT